MFLQQENFLYLKNYLLKKKISFTVKHFLKTKFNPVFFNIFCANNNLKTVFK